MITARTWRVDKIKHERALKKKPKPIDCEESKLGKTTPRGGFQLFFLFLLTVSSESCLAEPGDTPYSGQRNWERGSCGWERVGKPPKQGWEDGESLAGETWTSWAPVTTELHEPVTCLGQHSKDLGLSKAEGCLFLYWPTYCVLMPLIPKKGS